jgi:hypothetical protein
VIDLFGGIIRLSSAVKTTSPEAAKSLEQAWQRRRQELAGWQPSAGWLKDSHAIVKHERPAHR